MKKSLMAGLTGALLLGTMGTSFAASNPFTDVPRGHWAYDAVEQLRQDGVIEGYGDGTYRGERTITRYEMAQMIARAMDQFDQQVKGLAGQKPVVQNVGADRAMLDRLAAEFHDELESLGVRVSNLEKYSDKIVWNGKIEYTYISDRLKYGNQKYRTNSNKYVFRLEPKAEINDHWTANARLDVDGDFKDDSMSDVKGKRVWAQGDYDHFQIKAGKFEFYPNENGLIFDTNVSGGQLTYKSGDFSITGIGGRITLDPDTTDVMRVSMYGNNNDPAANIWSVNLQYAHPTGFELGAGYYRFNTSMYRVHPSYVADSDTHNIFSVNAGYNFSDKAKLWGAYSHGKVELADGSPTLPSYAKNSWQAELDLGNYNDASEKGQWKIYGAYRHLGFYASIAPTEDGVEWGQKGWEFGASYAPFKNIGLVAKYTNSAITSDVDGRFKKLFGRVELFF
ncbi:MAG: S-layer homology domain-containing protein [Selenomonadaceae bacterium]|nr:S-layer homology domain-containing protein [Selenomonadaceae bacterium]